MASTMNTEARRTLAGLFANEPISAVPETREVDMSDDALPEWMRREKVALLERINAAAEADMLAGRPVTGAHHRAIERELARLKKEARK